MDNQKLSKIVGIVLLLPGLFIAVFIAIALILGGSPREIFAILFKEPGMPLIGLLAIAGAILLKDKK